MQTGPKRCFSGTGANLGKATILLHSIQRSEVNTREKLLEIEYRLAELAEKVETADKKDKTD